MRKIEVDQGTQEWLEARLGCPSGSAFKRLVTSRGERSTTADTYINELIAERLTGAPTGVQETEWMIRGKQLEIEAKSWYEMTYGVWVEEVGFLKHDDYECGVSPDGLINSVGGIEIKCPKPSTHIQYLRSGNVPSIYKAQIQGCLWITGREYWDWMSYHPEMPPLVIRVSRDEEFIGKLESHVFEACEVIEKVSKQIEAMK